MGEEVICLLAPLICLQYLIRSKGFGSPPWVSKVTSLSHNAKPPSKPTLGVQHVWICIPALQQAPEDYMTCYKIFCWAVDPLDMWHKFSTNSVSVSCECRAFPRLGEQGVSGGMAGGWNLERGQNWQQWAQIIGLNNSQRSRRTP